MSEIIVRIPTSHAREVVKGIEKVLPELPRGSHAARELRSVRNQIIDTLDRWKLPIEEPGELSPCTPACPPFDHRHIDSSALHRD